MTPLFDWRVRAEAADETDAAVVADVLAGALRDERNDPDEPVEVSFRPAEQACRDCGELFPHDPDADRCPSCVAASLGEPAGSPLETAANSDNLPSSAGSIRHDPRPLRLPAALS